jgi:LDH2 family malate/lactate/ureidoglycolate dehydrogenase
MCELMGGALSGMAPSCLPEYAGGNGTLLIALKIAAFVPLAQFTDQTDRFATAIQSAPAAPGFKSVLMPGAPEWQMRQSRLERGIELPDRTWTDIRKLADELNVVLWQ